jgi:hypothetical protein
MDPKVALYFTKMGLLIMIYGHSRGMICRDVRATKYILKLSPAGELQIPPFKTPYSPRRQTSFVMNSR